MCFIDHIFFFLYLDFSSQLSIPFCKVMLALVHNQSLERFWCQGRASFGKALKMDGLSLFLLTSSFHIMQIINHIHYGKELLIWRTRVSERRKRYLMLEHYFSHLHFNTFIQIFSMIYVSKFSIYFFSKFNLSFQQNNSSDDTRKSG